MITLKEQEDYIKANGWHTYYNPKYWVNVKTVKAPNCQDYTNYGMDLNSAYCFEKLNLPQFTPMPFPSMSQEMQGRYNMTRIKELLETLERS